MHSLTEQLLAEGIRLRSYQSGEYKITCPKCQHLRKKNRHDTPLSVSLRDGSAVWLCHHCDWRGAIGIGQGRKMVEYVKPELDADDPNEKLYELFLHRGISREVVDWAGIKIAERKDIGRCIAFPVTRHGEIINVKYRSHDKQFRQIAGAEKIFIGLDTIDGDEVVVCEGEFDWLSALECGYSAISVPDGAPKNLVSPDSSKFDFIANCSEFLDGKQFIIAVDNDEPGHVLEEELSRRLGKDICRKAVYPDGCKDLNDVLCRHGKQAVVDCLRDAEPYPIEGVFKVEDYTNAVIKLYRTGRERGLSTGWKHFDEHVTVRAGDVWVVTGTPGSGKSEFLDSLAVNLVHRFGWRFGVSSFENEPDEHVAKWASKHTDSPFWDGPTQRMSEDDLRAAVDWANQHFFFIRTEDDEPPTIDWVLEKARALVSRWGIRGLIIDPYNELAQNRGQQTETDYVSQMLGRVRRFAASNGVAVFFVAHPKQLQRKQDGTFPVPTLYDISGSANWVNKADVGIVVHRDDEKGAVDVFVRKVRRKEIGIAGGYQTFLYDVARGTYRDVPTDEFEEARNR